LAIGAKIFALCRQGFVIINFIVIIVFAATLISKGFPWSNLLTTHLWILSSFFCTVKDI